MAVVKLWKRPGSKEYDYFNGPDGLTIPHGEAALITCDGRTDIQLVTPELGGDPVPDSMLFFGAMIRRWSMDPDFVQEQIAWFSKETAN